MTFVGMASPIPPGSMASPIPPGKRRRVDTCVPLLLTEGEARSVSHSTSCDEVLDVICLSQNTRRSDDAACLERNAIILSEPRVNWDNGISTFDFLIGCYRSVIWAAAFKELEKNFTEGMKSVARLREHVKVVGLLVPTIRKRAKKVGVSITSAEWFLQISFSQFAFCIRPFLEYLQRDPLDSSAALLSDLLNFVSNIMDSGIVGLESTLGEEDTEEKAAIVFLKEKQNVEELVHEWAEICILKGESNDFSHPFSETLFADKEKSLAFLESTVGSNFCLKFPHVSRVSIIEIRSAIAKQRTKERNDSVDVSFDASDLIASAARAY